MRRIGEFLVAGGSLTEDAVARALHYQRMSGSGVRLGTILLNWDLLPEQILIEELGRLHRCDAVLWPALSKAPPHVVKMLPAAAAMKLGAIPYALEGGTVLVAFLNPSDLRAVDEAAALLGKRLRAGVTSEVRLLQAHNKFYGRYLPQETRSLIYRLQRKPASVEPSDRMRTAGEVVDFRAPDLVRWEHGSGRRRGGAAVAPAEAAAVPTAAPSKDHAASRPTKPRGLPPPPDFYAPEPAPEFPMPQPAAEASASPEESLQEWVGEALGSFQREALRGTDVPVVAETAPAPIVPEAASASVASEAEITQATAGEGREPIASAPAGEPESSPAPNGSPSGGHWRISRFDEKDDAAVTGMWTGKEAPAGAPFPEMHSREEVVAETIEAYLPAMPRVLVLGSGTRGIVSWYARVPDLIDPLPEVWIAPHERSIFTHVERTGAPHFGPLEVELWPLGLAEVTGSKPPECAVFPVRVGDSIAAFLYADRLGQPMLYEDFGVLTRAAGALSTSLSLLLLNSNSAARTQ